MITAESPNNWLEMVRVLSLFLGTVMFFIPVLVFWGPPPWKHFNRWEKLAEVMYCLVTLCLVIWPFCVRQVPGHTIAVNRTGEIARVFEKEEVFSWWRFKNITGAGGNLYSYKLRTITVEMTKTVAPHTTLTYTVECDILGSPEKFKEYFTQIASRGKNEAEVVSKELYEFNREHEADFVEFYNPLRPEQQSAFTRLLIRFLEPRLAGTGVVPKKARFRVS